MTLIHGGQLNHVKQQFPDVHQDWLDLSTGISPFAYPIPEIPKFVWQSLPQVSESLLQKAKHYYQCSDILAAHGSQSIIQILPKLWLKRFGTPTSVFLPKVGYKEHQKAWSENQFPIELYDNELDSTEFSAPSIVVCINPNNPTGFLHSRQHLLRLLSQLQHNSGWLIVDEAFMDVIEEDASLMKHANHSNLFVLRSMGKFFGLAGIRVGFVSSCEKNLNDLSQLLGPWSVNGPALFVAEQALQNRQWQQEQQQRLKQSAQSLESWLKTKFRLPVTGTSLFKTLHLENATQLWTSLCHKGIYVRLCDEKNALRFGIPTLEQLQHLKLRVQL